MPNIEQYVIYPLILSFLGHDMEDVKDKYHLVNRQAQLWIVEGFFAGWVLCVEFDRNQDINLSIREEVIQ